MPPIKNVTLSIDQPVALGATGDIVKQIQEWLCWHHSADGFSPSVQIDGHYGDATVESVKLFQRAIAVPVPETGVVDPETFNRMVAPMRAVLQPIDVTPKLGDLVVRYARQHCLQHPLEVGGQNRGPWVRLYMAGHEGDGWPWCAGFAGFCLQQAVESAPFKSIGFALSFSCTALAVNAQHAGHFVRGNGKKPSIAIGSLFLRRKSGSDSAWEHTGIITELNETTCRTTEGNTNSGGSREGYEVCDRIRSYKDLDFISVG